MALLLLANASEVAEHTAALPSGWTIVGYIGALVAGYLIAHLLSPYLRKKSENLATRQDIEGITSKVEEVKHEYAAQLESIKVALSSRLYIHQTRYEKEYQLLSQLSQRLVRLRDAALVLRPELDIKAPGESEEDTRRYRLGD